MAAIGIRQRRGGAFQRGEGDGGGALLDAGGDIGRELHLSIMPHGAFTGEMEEICVVFCCR